MGTEFKIEASNCDIFNAFDVHSLKTFSYKTSSEDGDNFLLGFNPILKFPEVTIWRKDNALGITAYDFNGAAWKEVIQRIALLHQKLPDLKISDWDSGDEVDPHFFID